MLYFYTTISFSKVWSRQELLGIRRKPVYEINPRSEHQIKSATLCFYQSAKVLLTLYGKNLVEASQVKVKEQPVIAIPQPAASGLQAEY